MAAAGPRVSDNRTTPASLRCAVLKAGCALRHASRASPSLARLRAPRSAAARPVAAMALQGTPPHPGAGSDVPDNNRFGTRQPSSEDDLGGPWQLQSRCPPFLRPLQRAARHQISGAAASRHPAWYISTANLRVGVELGVDSSAPANPVWAFAGARGRDAMPCPMAGAWKHAAAIVAVLGARVSTWARPMAKSSNVAVQSSGRCRKAVRRLVALPATPLPSAHAHVLGQSREVPQLARRRSVLD